MPEIWLNYGLSEVVLDIRAENLEQNIDSRGKNLDDKQIAEKLTAGLDLSKPIDLVILHNSKTIHKIVSMLFLICEQKSLPFPKILADKKILSMVKVGLPEGSIISEFDVSNGHNNGDNLNGSKTNESLFDSNLVFMSEVELDGLFGFETISTRLLRRFGNENMLTAYARRKDNLPAPGVPTQSIQEAKKFVDGFEITGIEILANSQGIVDIVIDHPSKTMDVSSKSLESIAIHDMGQQQHKAMVISTGKDSSNHTLGKSLSSIWNCYGGIKQDGLAILLAECMGGLGYDALQFFVENRSNGIDRLKSPSRYVDGMESLLYLQEIQKIFQVGIVSVLPEHYIKRLGMVPLHGAKYGLDYILKVQGGRQKVVVISDGARVLLR